MSKPGSDTKQATPGPGVAAYHRPKWMSDKQWQEASADLTEQWLTILARTAYVAFRGGEQ